MRSYYLLSSTTKAACSISKGADKQAYATWLCAGCSAPKPSTKEINVTIEDEKLENTPLNFLFGCGLGIARKDFLFGMGESSVRRDLYLGILSREDGTPFKEWVTFNGKKKIIVRGSKSISHRYCHICGRHVYFALGKPYLYSPPPEGCSIFDNINGGLVVAEDLIQRISINKWQKLSCSKLPILDKPLDGLSDLVDPY